MQKATAQILKMKFSSSYFFMKNVTFWFQIHIFMLRQNDHHLWIKLSNSCLFVWKLLKFDYTKPRQNDRFFADDIWLNSHWGWDKKAIILKMICSFSFFCMTIALFIKFVWGCNEMGITIRIIFNHSSCIDVAIFWKITLRLRQKWLPLQMTRHCECYDYWLSPFCRCWLWQCCWLAITHFKPRCHFSHTSVPNTPRSRQNGPPFYTHAWRDWFTMKPLE